VPAALQPTSEPPVAIRRVGSGPPIVLTHGFGDSAATWDPLVARLRSRFETLCWDLLGHGDAAKPVAANAYSLERALGDLDSVIARAGSDAVLIGHSLGGYLSQYRAVRDLRGVRALVLIATGPGFRSIENREKWNAFVRRAGSGFDVPPAAVGLAEQHDDVVMTGLEQIRVPVLQIVGARDAQYHAAMKVLERRVPDVESMIVPGAGHHVHRSHADPVAERIASFIERLP